MLPAFLATKKEGKCNHCHVKKWQCITSGLMVPVPPMHAVKRKGAPVPEDTPTVWSMHSRTSVSAKASSLHLVVLLKTQSLGSTSANSPLASSSLLSPIPLQPAATVASLIAKLDHIHSQIGADMMRALVEIAWVRVQLDELADAAEDNSAHEDMEGGVADDNFVPDSDTWWQDSVVALNMKENGWKWKEKSTNFCNCSLF